MYQIVTLEDEVAVPPTKFNLDLDEALKESIGEKFEGKLEPEIGVPLAVTEVLDVQDGAVLPGDPAVHYPAKFRMLCWQPKEHELVEGEVVDITEWGAFIRVGAMDGLVHISQVMDDFVSFDEKNSQLVGRESRRVLKVGDRVRARIINISLKETNKIGLTMRQPFLGNVKWLEASAKKEMKETKEAKPEKKEEKSKERKK